MPTAKQSTARTTTGTTTLAGGPGRGRFAGIWTEAVSAVGVGVLPGVNAALAAADGCGDRWGWGSGCAAWTGGSTRVLVWVRGS